MTPARTSSLELGCAAACLPYGAPFLCVMARPLSAAGYGIRGRLKAFRHRPRVLGMTRPTTLGALVEGGYQRRTVKEEIRDNLLRRLRTGEPVFPGILGFEDTVIPQLESALLAGHDFVLLGERG